MNDVAFEGAGLVRGAFPIARFHREAKSRRRGGPREMLELAYQDVIHEAAPGVIALFGGAELRTLPYLLYERLGAYRLDEASAIGLLLVAIAFALAYASSRWSDAGR